MQDFCCTKMWIRQEYVGAQTRSQYEVRCALVLRKTSWVEEGTGQGRGEGSLENEGQGKRRGDMCSARRVAGVRKKQR